MDGELVMCSIENNSNKITRKQQQNNNKISKQCVYLKQVPGIYFNICECFMHNITII